MSEGRETPGRLAVSYRPVSDLTPDPRNARTHPKQQIEQIKASIAAFGFTNPILADPEGRIIAGHGRLIAAKAMGMAEVPVIALVGLPDYLGHLARILQAVSEAYQGDVQMIDSSSIRVHQHGANGAKKGDDPIAWVARAAG